MSVITRARYSTYRSASTGSALAVLNDCKATVANATAAAAAVSAFRSRQGFCRRAEAQLDGECLAPLERLRHLARGLVEARNSLIQLRSLIHEEQYWISQVRILYKVKTLRY